MLSRKTALGLVIAFMPMALALAESRGRDPDDSPGSSGEGEEETPSYFVVPLKGTVGGEITASAIEEAFRAGLRREHTIIVLEIDSPGGLVSECEKIIDLLGKHRERRSIALVKKRALSAAAILALTCDEIYIDSGGMIGAATAIQKSAAGVSAVGEKFASVWRATCRRAAEIGGHDPLFADAMVDAEVELGLVEEEGRERLVRGSSGQTIVPAGKLLTATAREAHDFGLATGLASSPEDIAKADAALEDWKPVSTRGISIMKSHALGYGKAAKRVEAEIEEAQKAFDRAVEYDPARQTYRVGKGNRFTPASLAKWRRYSAKCSSYLGKCERALNDVVSLARRYPLLEPQSVVAAAQLEQVEKIRDAIKQRARRQGL